nr:MAG TPA: tumor protein D52 family protein [Caudoviricetes sp.]
MDRDLEAELSKIEEEIKKLENYKKEILKKLGRG